MPRSSTSGLTAITSEWSANTEAAANQLSKRRMIMKTILSALVALSVIAGVAGGAVAMDAKAFYERVDRDYN